MSYFHKLISLKQHETLEQKVADRTKMAETRAIQLQFLAVEIIEAEDRERKRISELLHEDLQQILAAARMQLQMKSLSGASDLMLKNVEKLLEHLLILIFLVCRFTCMTVMMDRLP